MIKNMGALLFGLLLMLASVHCDAVGISQAKISLLEIDDDIASDVVFIKLAATKGSYPACQINTAWDFVISLSTEQGKHLYAMLLIAKAQQVPVSVRGIGQCDVFGSIETATGVALATW